MRLFFTFSLWLCGVLLMAPAAFGDETTPIVATPAPPRIAIWEPQISSVPDANGEDAINIDQDRIDRIGNWLSDEKVSVTLLTAADIRDTTVFNTEKFDAIFLPGDALVRWLVGPLRDFAQKGGVLVAINARNQPWSVPLVPNVNGKWMAQPKGKRMDELATLFGTKWEPLSDENGAGAHYFSDLVQTNLPVPKPIETEEATAEPIEPPDYSKPVLRDFLPAPKVTVEAGTILKPLIISRKSETNSTEKTPQAFMLQKESAKAIIVCNTAWSSNFEDGGYAKAPQFWNAIARISQQWHQGAINLNK